MSTSCPLRRVVVLVCVLVFAAAWGCSRLTSDETVAGPGVPQGNTDTAPTIEADAGDVDVGPGPGTTVASEQPTSGARVTLTHRLVGEQVVVDVVLNSFADLVGLSGHLRYDPKGLQLEKVVEHSALKSKGFDSRTVARESPAGRVLLGVARFRIDTRPWDPPEGVAVGQQVLVTMTFNILAEGSHRIHFDSEHALAKNASYEDINPAWGELTVHRQEVSQ